MRHRIAALAFVLAVAPACSSSSGVSMPMRSMMAKSTEGVVLHDGAVLGDAGMADWICVIDTQTGDVLGDQDLGLGTDTLLDAHGDIALAKSEGRLFTLDSATLVPTPSMDIDAISGRVLDDGVAALFDQDGCGVAFSRSEGDVAWSLGDRTCDATMGFAADRETGNAWLADGTSLTTVSPDGQVNTFGDVFADMVDWDAANGNAIIANSGDDMIRAVGIDGTVSWGVRVSGQVHDIAVAGGAGLVVASVTQSDGGEIAILDGLSGEQLVSYRTPEIPTIEISSDGRSLALVTSDAVYFYDVNPDGSFMDTPTTEQVTDTNGAGAGTIIGIPVATAATAALIFD
jgi:hypothetical protein